MLKIDTAQCLRCAGCISVCPEFALTQALDDLLVDQNACTLCNLCIRFCPVAAISIEMPLAEIGAGKE